MFTFIVISVCFVNVLLVAIVAYLGFTLKSRKGSDPSVPVAPHRIDESQVVLSPRVIEDDSNVTIEPIAPKETKKASRPKAAAVVPTNAPAKPNRSDYADSADYKKAYDAWWRLCRKIEKGGTVAPKAETKPELVETKPEPKAKPEPKKATQKTNEPKAEVVETPKAETTETPKVPVSEPVTNHTKDELLEAIKSFNGVNIYEANLTVKFGKTELYIREINGTTALLANGKEVKLSAVPFNKALLENIIVACSAVVKKFEDKTGLNHSTLTPKDEVKGSSKPEPKKTPKDVQPISDNERYAQNTAEGIIRTMDNKNVQGVIFKDAITTTLVQPKTGKEVDAEIVGLKRDSKGTIMVCGELKNKKTFAFELAKAAPIFNLGTLRTMQKQINDGLANRKTANVTVEKMPSVA